MTIHHLDEVIEAREIREAAAAELRKAAGGANPVVEWLRSDEGEEWSRDRHDSAPSEITVAPTLWRTGAGRRVLNQDPCGRPPVTRGNAARGQR